MITKELAEPFGYYDPSDCLFSFPGFYSNEEELIERKIIEPLYTSKQLAAARLQGAEEERKKLAGDEGDGLTVAYLHGFVKGKEQSSADAQRWFNLCNRQIEFARTVIGQLPANTYLVAQADAAIAAAEQEKTK
jgi:hypothetical protein